MPYAVILTGAAALCAAAEDADIKHTRPNTWTIIDVGGNGQRNSVGLIFLPEEKNSAFCSWGRLPG